MSDGEDQAAAPASLRWRTFRALRGAVTASLVAFLILAVVGRIVRDRSVPLAVMMYLPLLPLALGAVAYDLLLRGRALRRPRFVLAAAGACAAAWGVADLTGRPGRAADPVLNVPAAALRVVHWNVQWGGGKSRTTGTWHSIDEEIRRHEPDLVVLSEGPPRAWLEETCAAAGWNFAQVQSGPRERYKFNLAVCAAGPVAIEREGPISSGRVMLARVSLAGAAVRVLVVDGVSDPGRLRTPLLHDVASLLEAAREAGAPVDLVAGDFNAVARSVGFDRVETAGEDGYQLASRFTPGWRATFPAGLPLYDIDHVWVSGRHAIRSHEMLRSPHTNHLGQRVLIELR